jgi:TonB family protein
LAVYTKQMGGLNIMHAIRVSSFPIAASLRVSVLALLLLPLLPATSSGQEATRNKYRVVEVSQSQKAGNATEEKNNAEILSDTRGVDFGPYIKQVIQATKGAWMEVIPVSAREPQSKQGRVGIRFKIDTTGRVSGMLLEHSSGDVGLDRAAWGGITGAAPYPPLPAAFTGPYLELRLGFFYNLDPDKIGTAN